METGSDAASTPESGAVGRLFGAVELIASAHASRARDEAGRDLSRIGSGAALVVVATFFFVPTLLLVDVAVALLLRDRAGLALYAALLSVAGANAAIALGALLVARARLASPVLVETRATIKRAALVIRGA